MRYHSGLHSHDAAILEILLHVLPASLKPKPGVIACSSQVLHRHLTVSVNPLIIAYCDWFVFTQRSLLQHLFACARNLTLAQAQARFDCMLITSLIPSSDCQSISLIIASQYVIYAEAAMVYMLKPLPRIIILAIILLPQTSRFALGNFMLIDWVIMKLYPSQNMHISLLVMGSEPSPNLSLPTTFC